MTSQDVAELAARLEAMRTPPPMFEDGRPNPNGYEAGWNDAIEDAIARLVSLDATRAALAASTEPDATRAAREPGERLRASAKRLLGVALVKDAATLAALVDLEHEVYGSLAAADPSLVRLPGESPCKFESGDGWYVCVIHGWSGPPSQRSRVLVCPDVNRPDAAGIDVERLARALEVEMAKGYDMDDWEAAAEDIAAEYARLTAASGKEGAE